MLTTSTMSFGREFEQSPMDTFLFKKGNQSDIASPIKGSNENMNDSNLQITLNRTNTNINSNSKKATKYDYLDYGNYLNRIISAQLMIDGGAEEINWNLPRTADKVNVINAMLSIIENKKLYESLLQQSRDTIETLKIDLHSNEMKVKSVTQQNKQLNDKISAIFQRKEHLEIELKKQSNASRDRIKALVKENEQLKYRDKRYQNDIRKKEKIYKAQQEKIKKLLDDRDKKSYKCLGMKLLNNSMPTSILNHPNSLNSTKSVLNREVQKKQYQESMDKQHRLMDDNNLLQSQIAHFQKQLQSVLNENSLLRESLLRLEVNCKESLLKINDLFANNSNQIAGINSFKYSMPFDKDTQNLVNADIESSVQHLSNVLDELKTNIDATNNTEKNERMRVELVRLQTEIEELRETNQEYESLIKTYVNSE